MHDYKTMDIWPCRALPWLLQDMLWHIVRAKQGLLVGIQGSWRGCPDMSAAGTCYGPVCENNVGLAWGPTGKLARLTWAQLRTVRLLTPLSGPR